MRPLSLRTFTTRSLQPPLYIYIYMDAWHKAPFQHSFPLYPAPSLTNTAKQRRGIIDRDTVTGQQSLHVVGRYFWSRMTSLDIGIASVCLCVSSHTYLSIMNSLSPVAWTSSVESWKLIARRHWITDWFTAKKQQVSPTWLCRVGSLVLSP